MAGISMKIHQYVILTKSGEYLSIDESGKPKYVKSLNKAALFETKDGAEWEYSSRLGDKIKRLTFVLQEKK